MPKKIITFDDTSRQDILDAFDMAVDDEGFIVEKANPKQRVLTREGDWIKAEKLACIKKGSLQFFKSDLPSLISLSDQLDK